MTDSVGGEQQQLLPDRVLYCGCHRWKLIVFALALSLSIPSRAVTRQGRAINRTSALYGNNFNSLCLCATQSDASLNSNCESATVLLLLLLLLLTRPPNILDYVSRKQSFNLTQFHRNGRGNCFPVCFAAHTSTLFNSVTST